MQTYRLAAATLGATLLLIVAGGLVHATGSALACPDWPLCYGTAFPEMKGGVLYEHGHRLIAGTVALLTAVLAALLLRRWHGAPRAMGGLAWGAVLAQGALFGRLGWLVSSSSVAPAAMLVVAGAFALAVIAIALWLVRRTGDAVPAIGLVLGEVVVCQAALGGLTVLLGLPTLVSTAHLATSMLYTVLLVALLYRLRPGERAGGVLLPRRWVLLAAALVYVQVLLGAFVRHTGSALACNVEILTCNGAVLPTTGPELLLWTHRLFALLVTAVVLGAAWVPLREAWRLRRSALALLAAGAMLLVLGQVGLGVLTVLSYVEVGVATAHLFGGALLLVDLVALFYALGPLRARAADDEALGSLLPAPGTAG